MPSFNDIIQGLRNGTNLNEKSISNHQLNENYWKIVEKACNYKNKF